MKQGSQPRAEKEGDSTAEPTEPTEPAIVKVMMMMTMMTIYSCTLKTKYTIQNGGYLCMEAVLSAFFFSSFLQKIQKIRIVVLKTRRTLENNEQSINMF
jgi:hypothetical protein